MSSAHAASNSHNLMFSQQDNIGFPKHIFVSSSFELNRQFTFGKGHKKLEKMPRKAKRAKSKEPESLEDENSQNSDIANVNNESEDERHDGRRRRNAKKSCISTRSRDHSMTEGESENEANEEAVKEQKNKKMQKKTSKRKRSCSAAAARANTAVAEINIQEEGRLIQMSVNDQNDTFDEACQNYVQLNADEDSEDGEINFRNDEMEDTTTEPGFQNDSNMEDLELDQRQNGSELDSAEKNKKTPKEKICALDQEMKEKIVELHKLMSEGGLTESAQMLNNCLPLVNPERRADSGERHNTNQYEVEQGLNQARIEFDLNANCNASHNLNNRVVISKNSRSEETINESAVPKRTSLSSEDELCNISDEELKIRMANNEAVEMADCVVDSGQRDHAVNRQNNSTQRNDQAWALRFRDRHNNQQYGPTSGYIPRKQNDACRRFNRGKCNLGTNCRYDHKCSYCNKFGHGSLHCRKAS